MHSEGNLDKGMAPGLGVGRSVYPCSSQGSALGGHRGVAYWPLPRQVDGRLLKCPPDPKQASPEASPPRLSSWPSPFIHRTTVASRSKGACGAG